MKTLESIGRVKPALLQVQNNTTHWIGHLLKDPVDHFAGQTFQCPYDGLLDNIQVYSSVVQQPGQLVLTLHDFDQHTKKWGPPINSSSVLVERDSNSKWIHFALEQVLLERGRTYGFKIRAEEALVAIGEAATGINAPFVNGQEWTASSTDMEGHFFTYFSLAFKVEMRA
jgi:hypothetical protein